MTNFNLLKSNFEVIIPKDENIDFEQYVGVDQNLITSELIIIPSVTIDIDNSKSNNSDDLEGLDEYENDNIEDKISLNEAAHYLDKLKTYSLQRQNKVFSNSVLKLVNQLENMIFTEPKDYKQTCLDFYLNR